MMNSPDVPLGSALPADPLGHRAEDGGASHLALLINQGAAQYVTSLVSAGIKSPTAVPPNGLASIFDDEPERHLRGAMMQLLALGAYLEVDLSNLVLGVLGDLEESLKDAQEELDDLSASRHELPRVRSLDQIAEAEGEYFHKVWYGRKWADEHGRWFGEDPQSQSQLDIIEQMVAVMHDLEQEYGKEALQPGDDFEWGMKNGKLSALRWVQGHEWDSLDT
jgi:hypothetical protein